MCVLSCTFRTQDETDIHLDLKARRREDTQSAKGVVKTTVAEQPQANRYRDVSSLMVIHTPSAVRASIDPSSRTIETSDRVLLVSWAGEVIHMLISSSRRSRRVLKLPDNKSVNGSSKSGSRLRVFASHRFPLMFSPSWFRMWIV